MALALATANGTGLGIRRQRQGVATTRSWDDLRSVKVPSSWFPRFTIYLASA